MIIPMKLVTLLCLEQDRSAAVDALAGLELMQLCRTAAPATKDVASISAQLAECERVIGIVRSAPARAGLGRMEHCATPAEPSKFKLQNSRFDLSRPVNIGIAASVTLVMVACATSVGDGYTMSQDHNARIEAVENVQSILNNI